MDAASVQEMISALPLAEATCCLLRENMDEQRLTDSYDKHRGRSYLKVITFPVMVRMIGDALLQEGGTAHRAFGRAQEEGDLEASMVAAYGKLARIPINLSMVSLTDSTEPLLAMFPKQARRKSPPCLKGFETIILDGKAIRGFVAKNQKRDCESISIENLFHDTREELTTLSMLLRRGVICLDDIPPRHDNLQRQLIDLLKNQWSDLWIKAKSKNRRPHVPHSGKRTHSSVFRLLNPELKRC